jgi:PTH1 family peptidyl-tRNA hydrolase
VGLGNPGPGYAKTRHNVGFRLVEALAEGAEWRNFQGLGRFTVRDSLLLAKPMTFMNESGRFVAAFARYRGLTPEESLVCFDDVALPLGRLRFRAEGSSGGQKGMQSILEAFGTNKVPRARIGIGPQPPGRDSADFVLSRFSAAEEEALRDSLELAREAVLLAVEQGLEAAMNRFNPAP